MSEYTALDKLTGRADLIEQNKKQAEETENLRNELQALQGAVQYLIEDELYEPGIPIEPGELVGNLRELDSQLLNDMINRRQWEVIGGIGSTYYQDMELSRQRAVEESRFLSLYSPLATWTIAVWTNYGMGDSITVEPTNEDAQDVFNEFWNADRNSAILSSDNLQYLSNFTLEDGNTFLVFFVDKEDGTCTIDEIPCDEIQKIITHPERKTEKLLYKRMFQSGTETKTIYYMDWQARLSDRLTDENLSDFMDDPQSEVAGVNRSDDALISALNDKFGTEVVVMHIAHNRKIRGDNWGWPIFTAAAPYIKAHKKFLEDRLTVAASKAMYVRHKQIKGGSRAVDSIATAIKSRYSQTNFVDNNPAAAAGSVELDNEAIRTTEKPMTTGASDAKNDEEMFSWMALIGAGLFPTTAGKDTARWATALAMDKTLAMQWSRYQTFWAAQFQRMVKIVLGMKERFTDEVFVNKDGEQQLTANVSIDTLSLVDFPDVVDALSSAANYMLKPYLDNGIIPDNTGKQILREMWLILLQSLGLKTSHEIASNDAFEIDSEEFEALPKATKIFLEKARKQFKSLDIEGLKELIEYEGE